MTPEKNQIESVGGAETVREQDKVMLVLAYLGIFCLIPLLTVKDSPYVKWHAKQGLTLAILGTVILMVIGVIPVVQLLNCLLGPGLLVVMIMSILKALKGERWRVPIVADLSEKF